MSALKDLSQPLVGFPKEAEKENSIFANDSDSGIRDSFDSEEQFAQGIMSPGALGLAAKDTSSSAGHNNLGTFNGCFVPCALNIMGIILFLRLGWGIGQAGVLGVGLIFLIAETLAILTVLSFSAIVTNGEMSGGGSYYMISRCLGPEFGGAIGTLFYLAYAVGTSFYVVGFSTEIVSIVEDFLPCLGECGSSQNTANWIRIFGTSALLVCLLISYGGAAFFSKFNIGFFGIQYLAIIIGLVSYVYPQNKFLTVVDVEVPELRPGNFTNMIRIHFNATCTGWRMENFLSNLYMPSFIDRTQWHYAPDPAACGTITLADGSSVQSPCDFKSVFSILFPAATGIMEGANLSGDLKNPGYSIPVGTLSAVVVSLITYTVLVITMAGSFPRQTLLWDPNFFQEATVWWPILAIGILISSLSSALGSLFGGSRVLQAVSRDELFPPFRGMFRFFAKGSKKGDEPRRAVLVTYLIAQACVMIGSLDIIAPIISSFFLMTYALCNFTTLALYLTGTPNFRPKFKGFTWWLSLLGGVLCLVIMFWINWWSAAGGILILTIIYAVLYFKGRKTDWGDLSQALVYHQVRKFLLKLDKSKFHTKFWRPSFLLLLCNDLDLQSFTLLGFLEKSKKGGLFIIGAVVVGSIREMRGVQKRLKEVWLTKIRTAGLKAFPQIAVAEDPRQAYQVLVSCSGLGGLDCNTVVLPLLTPAMNRSSTAEELFSPRFSRSKAPSVTQEEMINRLQNENTEMDESAANAARIAEHTVSNDRTYCEILTDTLVMERNLMLTRNYETLPTAQTGRKRFMHTGRKKCIDVWFDIEIILNAETHESPKHARSDSLSNVELEISFDDTKALMMQMAHIVHTNPEWARNSTLRVFKVLRRGLPLPEEQIAMLRQRMRDFLKRCRIEVSDVIVVREPRMDPKLLAVPPVGILQRALFLSANAIIQKFSENTCQIYCALPFVKRMEWDDPTATEYLQCLDVFSKDLPPLALCCIGESGQIMTPNL